ncbi:MAG: hypothetical protein NVS2B12_06230 [Ktedonobacteraceae bacterium]
MRYHFTISTFIFWYIFKLQWAREHKGLPRSFLIATIMIMMFPTACAMPQVKNSSDVPVPSHNQNTKEKYLFGTLGTANGNVFNTLRLTSADIASREHNAGVAIAHVEIAWKDYETADGVFDQNSINSSTKNIITFLRFGQKVDLQLAVHYTPSWVMHLPDAQYLNQHGIAPSQSSNGPNYVFNAIVRQKVQDFEMHALQEIDRQVGLNAIWDFRVDGGEGGEALYPEATDILRHSNSYWAYDNNAQGKKKNLPFGVSATPFPGWLPGQTKYHGQPFTTEQVAQWYNWYFESRMNYYNWQIALYRNAGFKNYLTIETPGFGTRPDEFTMNKDHYLNGVGDPNGTMSRAAVWQNLYPLITNKSNIIAYVTSMADSGSQSPNDMCQPEDRNVDFNKSPNINTWGAARYVSFIANKYGLLKGGENPGYGAGAGSDYGIPMLERAAKEMASCQFIGMFWAHDDRLYTHSKLQANTITLADYANVIHQYNYNGFR